MVPLDRQTAQREGLLSLARALVIAHQGGTFSETLEIVTEALGADGGAAYELEQEGLVLVAHRGLTMDLRVALERLPKADEPWFIAALVSWGIAFFEYLLQVPANRIGSTTLSLPQLKILQEVITLTVFVPFVLFYMKQPLKWDYLWAGLCLCGAVYFVFRK